MCSADSAVLLLFLQKKKRGSSRLDRLGIPEEELLRQQQELFAQARQQQLEASPFLAPPCTNSHTISNCTRPDIVVYVLLPFKACLTKVCQCVWPPLQTEQAEYQRLIYQQLHSQPDSASLPTQEDLNLATVATATMATPTAATLNTQQPELDEDYDD